MRLKMRLVMTRSGGLRRQRPNSQSVAAERNQHEHEPECEHLPRRRDANVQSGEGEVIAERPGQLIAAASPKPAGFEQRISRAHKRRIDKMLDQEPSLQLIGSDHVGDNEIICSVIS
jgi:hypothetical protein